MPRRTISTAAKLLSVALSAGACGALLADAGAGLEGFSTNGPEPSSCSSLFAVDAAPGAFGLRAALGDSGERARAPALSRYSLCADAAPASLSTRPDAFRDAPAPPPARHADPRDRLVGVRNANASDATKFWRGMLLVTGTEIVSGAVLAMMPKQNTNWSEDALSRAGSNFARAWTSPPVWDGDIPFHNWIGHPYAGAFYYNMIRSQGGTLGQSFAFTALQSFLWEYVIEAWAEQPSIQDLVSTTLMGAALGELFHRWSVSILRKGDLNFGQKALVFFLNPSYVINNGYRPPG